MYKPYIQAIPSNNSSKTLTLYSYHGGLDNVSSQQTTRNECATNVLNMVYLEDGLIQKRFGTNPYNDTTAPNDIIFFDTFRVEGEEPKLVTATSNEIFMNGVKIQDIQGRVYGVSVHNKYMFVDGTALYSYEKDGSTWKCYKIISPTNLEDSLSQDAKKSDKVIYVNDGSKFKPNIYIQIGERKIDTRGEVSSTPPPQTVRVLKVEGNKITLGEVVQIDNVEETNTSSSNSNNTNETKSDTSTAQDEATVTRTKISGAYDGDYSSKTVTDSARKSGTSNQTTTSVATGVTVVTNKKNKKDEDDEEIVYDRLEYDHLAGTPIIIFPESEKYKYLGDFKTDETLKTKWYEPCTHEIRHAYFGVNVLPPKPTMICHHKNRVVLIGGREEGHIVYISETSNPYYFPVTNGVTLPANGDKVTGLTSFHDSLVLARSYDMHVLYGDTNNPDYGSLFTLKRITTHTGCSGGDSMVVAHNYMFYLGTDGVVYRMQTTQTDVNLLQTSVLTKTVDLHKAPFDLSQEDFDNACGVYHNDYYYLKIGSIVLVYSYRFQAWTVFDRLDPIYMGVLNNEIVWSKGKRLFHFDETTFLDEGVDFNCFWESKLFDLDLPVNYKYFKYISLVFDTYENFDSTAKLLFEIDYEEVTMNYIFKNAISRWGKARWGVDRFSKKNVSKSLPIYVGRRGRLVKVKVHNGNQVTHFFDSTSDLTGLVADLNSVAYIRSTGQHFKYTYTDDVNLVSWIELGAEEVNQPIKLYNIEIEYSIRGRR